MENRIPGLGSNSGSENDRTFWDIIGQEWPARPDSGLQPQTVTNDTRGFDMTMELPVAPGAASDRTNVLKAAAAAAEDYPTKKALRRGVAALATIVIGCGALLAWPSHNEGSAPRPEVTTSVPEWPFPSPSSPSLALSAEDYRP